MQNEHQRVCPASDLRPNGSNDHLPHELVQAVRVEMGCFNDSLRTWMSADSQHPHLPPIREAFDKLIVAIDSILPEPNGG